MAGLCEDEIYAALQNHDLVLAAVKAREYLERLKEVSVNVAVAGESGSGKSTLVKALGGRTEAAPELQERPQRLRVWELPASFTDENLQRTGSDRFDFFIIVTDKRFRENDATLAQAIQKMNKPVYFVRTHVECEEENHLKLRDTCSEELQKLRVKAPKLFLVSAHELHLYEFEDLCRTVQEELPEPQRDVLLLALPILGLDVLEWKTAALASKVRWYTLQSAVGAAVAVPGFSGTVDPDIIRMFTEQCLDSLGLGLDSLQRLSAVSRVPLEDLRAELKSPLAACEPSSALVLRVLTESTAQVTAVFLEEGVGFIPFIGTPVAVALSSLSSYRALKYILQTLADDARRVLIKAWGVRPTV